MLMAMSLLIIVSPFSPTFSQVVPETESAVLAGPVSIDGELGLEIAYSKKGGGLWFVGSSQFGETVEAEGEIIKLFHVSGSFYAGPVAGAGVDWSEAAGTGGVSTDAYFYGAAGVVAIYGISNRTGLWGIWKARISKIDREPKSGKIGFGFYLKL